LANAAYYQVVVDIKTVSFEWFVKKKPLESQAAALLDSSNFKVVA